MVNKFFIVDSAYMVNRNFILTTSMIRTFQFTGTYIRTIHSVYSHSRALCCQVLSSFYKNVDGHDTWQRHRKFFSIFSVCLLNVVFIIPFFFQMQYRREHFIFQLIKILKYWNGDSTFNIINSFLSRIHLWRC